MKITENKNTKRVKLNPFGFNNELNGKIKTLFNFFDESDNKYIVSVIVNNKEVKFGEVSCEVTIKKNVVIKESTHIKTPEGVEQLANDYANEKSSSEVFRDTHKKDFTSGYNLCLKSVFDFLEKNDYLSDKREGMENEFIKSLNE